MRRRRFLASSLSLLGTVAGCVGAGSPGAGTSGTPAGTVTDDPGPTSDAGPRSTGGPSTTGQPPVPAPASDVFADVECPSFDDAADRTVCYHAVDPVEADVLLAAHPEVFDPDPDDDAVEVLRFTLYNRSAWHFHFNHYAWGIERREDDGWRHVAPEAYPEPLLVLPPGATYTWDLPTATHPSPSPDRWMQLDVALDAGDYAFDVAGSFGPALDPTTTPAGGPAPTDGPTHTDRTETDPPDGRIECVALFRLTDGVDPDASGGPSRPTGTGTPGDG